MYVHVFCLVIAIDRAYFLIESMIFFYRLPPAFVATSCVRVINVDGAWSILGGQKKKLLKIFNFLWQRRIPLTYNNNNHRDGGAVPIPSVIRTRIANQFWWFFFPLTISSCVEIRLEPVRLKRSLVCCPLR